MIAFLDDIYNKTKGLITYECLKNVVCIYRVLQMLTFEMPTMGGQQDQFSTVNNLSWTKRILWSGKYHAPGGTRTHDSSIIYRMLLPLSYGRKTLSISQLVGNTGSGDIHTLFCKVLHMKCQLYAGIRIHFRLCTVVLEPIEFRSERHHTAI